MGKAMLAVTLLPISLLVVRGQEIQTSDPTAVRPDSGVAAPVALVPAPPPTPPSAPPAGEPRGWGNDGNVGGGFAASGREPLGLFGGGEVGHMPYRGDYRVTWFPDEEVKGQLTNLGSVRQDLSITCPIWQCAPDELSLSALIRNELFHTGAVFPDTGQPFPEQLWNIRLGTTYRHLFDNGWVTGGTLSVGSASDKPFHSIDEMTLGVNGFLRVPQGEHNAWLFTLSYSSNSELPIPIPGVAFLWQPSEQFRMNIGLPLVVMYRPTEDLTFDFSYMLLTTIHARATYRVLPQVRIYFGYDHENESYLPADRPEEKDRLFYYDERLTAGVQYLVSRCAILELSGGYTFDRYYFEGHSFSDRHQNRIDVGEGPFLSADFRVRW
jgi:hypothetical protein